MHYSYGLSVLNSHLVAGGTVVLTPHSFMRPEFWRDADQERATSFAGVPYMYETLHRLRFDPARHPTLRTFTQAGGALRRDLIAHFHGRVTEAGARLVVMYGQTEATARISYVPPERLGEKIGSIGIPIPGGTLRLERVEGLETGASELVYEGENVMLGYAESLADLGLGDVQQGVLRTGDLGDRRRRGLLHPRRPAQAVRQALRAPRQSRGCRAGAGIRVPVAGDRHRAQRRSPGLRRRRRCSSRIRPLSPISRGSSRCPPRRSCSGELPRCRSLRPARRITRRWRAPGDESGPGAAGAAAVWPSPGRKAGAPAADAADPHTPSRGAL